jgi:hypothetical protein
MPYSDLSYTIIMDNIENNQNCSYTQNAGKITLVIRLQGEHKLDIIGRLNSPPFAPCNPSPPDYGNHINVYSDLSWTGSDPDHGEDLTYTIFFKARNSTLTSDDIISDNQTGTSFNLSNYLWDGHMDGVTKYFWKVVSHDSHGASATSPVWCFKTGEVYGPYHEDNPPFP